MSDINTAPAPVVGRGTKRWVKVVWLVGLASIAFGAFISLGSPTIRPTEAAPDLSCGSMWSPDDSAAVEWAKGWEDARILSVSKLGVDLPDMQAAVGEDCAHAIGEQRQGAGVSIAFGLLLGLVGLVGRVRPSLQYRAVRT
ncbi:hypothetical protein GS439_06955 [Rhodococcus hoagii]|nr:hypothetical protein [Prescottella equi]